MLFVYLLLIISIFSCARSVPQINMKQAEYVQESLSKEEVEKMRAAHGLVSVEEKGSSDVSGKAGTGVDGEVSKESLSSGENTEGSGEIIPRSSGSGRQVDDGMTEESSELSDTVGKQDDGKQDDGSVTPERDQGGVGSVNGEKSATALGSAGAGSQLGAGEAGSSVSGTDSAGGSVSNGSAGGTGVGAGSQLGAGEAGSSVSGTDSAGGSVSTGAGGTDSAGVKTGSSTGAGSTDSAGGSVSSGAGVKTGSSTGAGVKTGSSTGAGGTDSAGGSVSSGAGVIKTGSSTGASGTVSSGSNGAGKGTVSGKKKVSSNIMNTRELSELFSDIEKYKDKKTLKYLRELMNAGGDLFSGGTGLYQSGYTAREVNGYKGSVKVSQHGTVYKYDYKNYQYRSDTLIISGNFSIDTRSSGQISVYGDLTFEQVTGGGEYIKITFGLGGSMAYNQPVIIGDNGRVKSGVLDLSIQGKRGDQTYRRYYDLGSLRDDQQKKELKDLDLFDID